MSEEEITVIKKVDTTLDRMLDLPVTKKVEDPLRGRIKLIDGVLNADSEPRPYVKGRPYWNSDIKTIQVR